MISKAYFRKGQTGLDLVFVLVFLLVMAMVALFLSPVISEFADDINNEPDMSAEAKAVFTNLDSRNASLWDGLFIFALGMLWVSLIVSSFLIDTNPIFFFITILVLILIFIVAMIMGNFYTELAEDDEIAAFAAEFPFINHVFANLLWYAVFMGLTAALSLYAKSTQG